TLSAKSDEEDISFPDTKEQTISYPTDKVQVLSLLVNHTGKGQTKSKNNIHVTDDTLWTPETSDGARKQRLCSNNYKDEDNPFDIIGTDLSDRMSEQNEVDIELDYIVQS
uniref:Uncharacterized protein n=1 Tax=Amphimedon queenslandica TaxID=400682 RepID=A0A1X7T364_AMPQE